MDAVSADQQLQQRQRCWTTTPSRPPPTSTTQRSNNKTKTLPRGPNVWETLPKDQGNSYRRVSNLLHIPKSTIYSYVTKRRASKGILAKKKNSKSPVKKIVYPPPVRVKVEINEQRTNFQSSDESQ
ncbi:hypothetical protein B566_EDAN015454 [Ephemera danica]|nr:hypothetical protein B566_EDAN015454 [Ephemera danica]